MPYYNTPLTKNYCVAFYYRLFCAPPLLLGAFLIQLCLYSIEARTTTSTISDLICALGNQLHSQFPIFDHSGLARDLLLVIEIEGRYNTYDSFSRGCFSRSCLAVGSHFKVTGYLWGLIVIGKCSQWICGKGEAWLAGMRAHERHQFMSTLCIMLFRHFANRGQSVLQALWIL